MSPYGLGLPVVQQVPGRAQAWEADAGGLELVRIAKTAERLGFTHLSCSDHVLVPRSRSAGMGDTWYDAAVTLAFLAGVTDRIGLLSHVLILPYRHPLVVAKAFGTLDRLSAGRLILGVGTGHLKPEFKILGVPYERRGALTDEAIDAVRAAWATPVAEFHGPTLEFRDVTISPRPVSRGEGRTGPPIWVGGNTMASVRRAARRGDGWIPWEITPDAFGSAVAAAREVEGARTIDFVAPLSVGLEDRAAEVLDRIAKWHGAGATRFHVGFAHRSLDQFLERMQWFRDEVVNATGMDT